MNPYIMIYSIVLTFIWLNHYMMANCIWIGLSNLELNLTGGRCIWQSWLIRITSFLAEGNASSTNENWPQQNNKLWWKNGINHQIINQFYQCKAQQCIHPCYIYFAYSTSQNNLFFRLENLELIEFLIPENLHKTLEKLEKLKSLSVWPDTSNQVSWITRNYRN